jgi:trigger factor
MTDVKSISEVKKEMIIEIPSEIIEEKVFQRLKIIGRKAKIKGFRPGKIPANVVKQHYGAEANQETLSELIQHSYSEAMAENNFRPVGSPQIEPQENKNNNNFIYKAIFEVLPVIKLKGLDGLKVDKPEVDITDKDLDLMMEKLRKQKRTWSEIVRKSTKDDQITIDFKGSLDGEVIQGGEGKNVPVVLGEGQMLPDFEKALLGLKSNDTKSFNVKFPKDYHSQELAGKKINFEVSVNLVEEPVLPELNDELAKEFGVKEGGMDKLKSDVKDNMLREVNQRVTQDLKEQIMNSLIKANNIEIPDVMHKNEIANMQKESMRQMGIKEDGAVPPAENFTELATKRVKLGLLLSQFIEDNSLTVDSNKLRERVEQMCAGYEDPSTMIDQYMNNTQFISQIEPIVIEEQAIALIAEKAKEKIKKISFTKYMDK